MPKFVFDFIDRISLNLGGFSLQEAIINLPRGNFKHYLQSFILILRYIYQLFSNFLISSNYFPIVSFPTGNIRIHTWEIILCDKYTIIKNRILIKVMLTFIYISVRLLCSLSLVINFQIKHADNNLLFYRTVRNIIFRKIKISKHRTVNE